MLTGAHIAITSAFLATAACADPCRDNAPVTLPVSYLLMTDYTDIKLQAIMQVDYDDATTVAGLISMPDAAFLPGVIAERMALLPDTAQDLPYLIVAAEIERYPRPVVHMMTMSESVLTPDLIAVFNRQGMTAQAQILQQATALFAAWDSTPDHRWRMVFDADGMLDGALVEDQINALEVPFLAARPTAMESALALIDRHPAVKSAYQRRLRAVTAEDRTGYLTQQLWATCMPAWWTPEEADAAFAALGPAQRDLLLLDMFLAESFNGSTHQYFTNSSGTMAPQLAETLERLGLPDHAAAVRTGMAVFPTPYPRSTTARRAVMASFSTAQDDALYDLTVWADDGLIADAMITRAQGMGILPR